LPGRLLTFPTSFFIESLASQGLSLRLVPAYDMAENAELVDGIGVERNAGAIE